MNQLPFTLFVSDVHLQPEEAHPINQAFYLFLDNEAPKAEALYLVGDIFEMWVGDDIGLKTYATAIQKLKCLSDKGLPIFYLYGNRDFLMRNAFWQATGITQIKEPALITIYGLEILLVHGDGLCTDDIEFQKMRKILRHPVVTWSFLHLLTPTKRLAIGNKMRANSKKYNLNKPENIMDVNQASLEALISQYPNCQHIIHGHTHRPAHHTFMLNGKLKHRWVLGDWRPEAQILKITQNQKIEFLTNQGKPTNETL